MWLANNATPAAVASTITHDPADGQVFAAALAAQAALSVSGDAHLLDLKSIQGIGILTALQAIACIEAMREA